MKSSSSLIKADKMNLIRQVEQYANYNSISRIRHGRLWLGLAFILLAGIWAVFAGLVVPSLVEQAYQGQSLTILNDIVIGVGRPLDSILRRWYWLVENSIFIGLGFGLIALIMTHPAFFRKFVGEATPESLGAIRILTCAILLASTLWEGVASTSLLPIEMRSQMGFISLFYYLPGFENFLASATSLQIFQILTALVLFLGMIGWRTRIVLPLGAFGYFLLAGIMRHYAWFYHTGLIPLYVLGILSLTPSGDGLSVDRWLKIRRGQPVPDSAKPSPLYGWSRYAVWIVVALPYVAAGLSKLRNVGLFWWDPTRMRNYLYVDSLNPMQFDWGVSLLLTSAPDIVFALLGISAILGELTYGTVLFSRTARRILPVFMGAMHIGILLTQNILFFDLILLQLVFFDFTEIRETIGRWFKSIHRSNRTKVTPGISTAQVSFSGFRFQLAISALLVVLLFCWFRQIEFFPFTAMQMYTQPLAQPEVATYYKVLAQYESGVTARAYPEDVIKAVADGRYRRVIRRCFIPERVQVCEKFLLTVGSTFNKDAPLGERMQQLEVQEWMWNFRDNPLDPQHGAMVDRFVAEIDVSE